MNKKILLLFVPLILVALYVLNQDSHPQEAIEKRNERSLSQTFSFDFKRVYDFETSSEMHIFFAGKEKKEKSSLTARWNINVLKKKADHFFALMQLSDIHLQTSDPLLSQTLKEIYSKLFIVELGEDGEILQSYFDCDKEDSRGLKAMLSTIEVVLRDKKEYQHIEKDAEGEVEVHYQRDFHDPLAIKKEKKRYLHMKPNQRIDIVKSNIKIALDNAWIDQVDSEEKIHYFLNGEMILSTKTKSLFVKNNRITREAILEIWNFDGEIETLIAHYKNKKKRSYLKEMSEVKKKLYFQEKGIDLDTLLMRVRANNIKEMNELEAYLKIYPEETNKVLNKIKNLGEHDAAAFISLLARVGTAQAQSVLQELMEDETFSHQGKLQVLMAFGDLRVPNVESIEYLWGIYEDRENLMREDLSNTALLSLGILSKQGEYSEDTMERIKEVYLSDKYDDEAKRIALLSMGNSNPEAFKSELFDALENQKSYIQAAAIRTLGKLDTEEVKEKFNQLFDLDHSSKEVRLAISKSILKMKPTKELIGKSQENLFKEGDPHIRKNIILYLLKNRDQYPQNSSVLQRFKGLEKDKNNQLLLREASL